MFTDFPNLHPLVVHFPIVLILLGAALQALLIFKDWQQVRWGTLIIMGGGFLGALAASTVFHAMPAGLSPQAAEVFNEHERYAGYTLWLSGFTFLLKGIGEFYRLHRRSYEIVVSISALAAAIFLSLAGHRGAQLVYIEGVGPKGNLLMKGDHVHGGSTQEMEDMPKEDHSEGGHQMNMLMDSTTGAGDKEGMPGMGRTGNQDGEAMNHGAGSANMGDMPGMNHGEVNQGQQKMDNMPGMSGMSHPTTKGSNGQNTSMPGMNHQMPGMNGTKSPKNNSGQMLNMPGMDSTSMDHQNMNSAGKKQGSMPGMDHGAMQMPNNSNSMNNMPGMSGMPVMPGMGNNTDLNGRPLIDATKPYDNNPAWEQKNRKKKQ